MWLFVRNVDSRITVIPLVVLVSLDTSQNLFDCIQWCDAMLCTIVP